MRYPVYQPTYRHCGYTGYSNYSSISNSSYSASSPTITPVGAKAPRMIGGSGSGFAPLSDDDDFLDWGDGDSESQTGGTIGAPNGDYTAAGVPIGNACWPLLLFICLYALTRTLRIAR